MPRVPYMNREIAPEDAQRIFEAMERRMGRVSNLALMLGHAPKLLQGFMALAGPLLGPGELPIALREMAYLTVAKLNGCAYCTAHHAHGASEAGVSPEKIAAIPSADSPALDGCERAIVRFASEMTVRVEASAEALDELRKCLNVPQIVELAFVVAAMNLFTRFADTLKIEPETAAV